MEYTMENKYQLIKSELLMQTSINPIRIVKEIMHKDFINIHGPEHHLLDGGALMVALKNAGLDIDLSLCLDELASRSIKMPGAMCGYWGVCGSISSIGAALSILDKTSPLSNDENYKNHMKYTSKTIVVMSEIGGPRCCKRNAYISLLNAIDYVKEHYNIMLDKEDIKCEFSSLNKQCILERCPFYIKNSY